ncbi:glycerate kinase family protein [Paenibacillus xylaniclasticus]|uniref:glycerate kinase family protein n=1 Tax=Paenibacillus xylaniclasticus TaxID=588083 RepID=UPI000FD80D81|nr:MULTISPECIES: glycerate kinase [Paenibacillus]GFN33992.1 glycerate kinase [Paenibacillus curdlanolyticus]
MGKVFMLAPDSFKESMTAKEVCEAMEVGIKRAIPDAICIHVPMADGGEGTVQSLVDATGGMLVPMEVTGPLGTPVQAHYGILGDGTTAVIEMASASGIHHVTKETRNPLITTTLGTGELIRACIEKGITNIILGIGGSATNDAGAGMATALGYKFLDKDGYEIPLGGGFLGELASIDTSNVIPQLREVSITIASDVTNPLCGLRGASVVFGPQKGATPEMVQRLDANLLHFSRIVEDQLGIAVADVPGAGGAGGLGAGLMAFTNSRMKKGVDIVIEYTGLEHKMKDVDYCFTGEGGIDIQTKFGKTPYGVAQVARRTNKQIKVIALAGCIGKNVEDLYEEGFDAIFGIVPGAANLEDLLVQGKDNVARTAESVARLLR